MPCGCTENNKLNNNKGLDNDKKLNLESMQTLSIDEIISLYRQGYILNDVDTASEMSNINVLTYETQCSGSPEIAFNYEVPLAGTFGAVQKGKVWAQRFYGNFRCLDFVRFNMQRLANVNFHIEIRKDDGVGEGKPLGVPLADDSGLILRTPSISYNDIPTISGWVSSTVVAILPTDTYYWICFVPVDFNDSPIYRDDPTDDRFLLQDTTNIADKRSAVFMNGIWANSSTFAFSAFKLPTFVANCTAITDVVPNPSTVTVNNPVTLSATTTPSGIFTVEFFNADSPTQIFVTDVATTPKSSYSAQWTPTIAGTYHIKARVVGQCTSTNPVTVTVNSPPCTAITDVTPSPSTVTTGNPVTLSATTTPSGIFTVEFFNADSPTQIFVTDVATTPKSSYSAQWTPTIAGTYHIKARVVGQCTSTNPVTVTVNSPAQTCTAITDVTPSPSTVTVNNPVTLSATTTPAGAYTVEFFNVDNPTEIFVSKTETIPTTTYSNTWIPTVVGTYHVKARVGIQCTSTAAATVIVNPSTGITCASITTPTANPTMVAEGEFVVLSTTVTPSSQTAQEFFVQFMNGTTQIGSSVITASHVATKTWIPSAGAYNVSAKVGTECTSPGTVQVTVSAAPAAGGGGVIVIAAVALIAAAMFMARKPPTPPT